MSKISGGASVLLRSVEKKAPPLTFLICRHERPRPISQAGSWSSPFPTTRLKKKKQEAIATELNLSLPFFPTSVN
jgi:hypothetical protein